MAFVGFVVLAAAVAPSGWQMHTVVPGSGQGARLGDRVVVHFVARDMAGNVLADTERRGLTYSFVVGDRQATPALDRGVRGMRVGSMRRLVAPPSTLAGTDGNLPVVPPDAKLRITLRLMKIEKREDLAARLAEMRARRPHPTGRV